MSSQQDSQHRPPSRRPQNVKAERPINQKASKAVPSPEPSLPKVPSPQANRPRPIPTIYAATRPPSPLSPPPGVPSPRFHAGSSSSPTSQPAYASPQAQVADLPAADEFELSADFPPSPPAFWRQLITLRWVGTWQFLLLMTVGLVTGAMAFAMISLFRIPNLPNCRAIFWPTASAALRLQCAESYADQGTVDFLLEAIELVKQLPPDHPLRTDIDSRIEAWASQILDLADEAFHKGELDVAIATARKIPTHTAAAELVTSRIQDWNKVWDKASDIYETAKQKLSDRNFKDAFSLSVRLLDVDNEYWQTTKYNELTRLIGLARADSAKISKAERLLKSGSVENFKEALKLLGTIKPESVLYTEAQKARKGAIIDMLKVAETALSQQRLSQAEEILKEIPRNAGFNSEIADFQVFIEAYQRAWAGDALGLDEAITRLQSLDNKRPLYDRAQGLIDRWRSELQALAKLDQARQIAAGGSLDDLRGAIAEAQQIPQNNPRWQESNQQVRRWRERVETAEDQPILTRAEELASSGTPEALRAAIQEARRIQSGRALSQQANTQVAGWTRRIQQIEDQPLLDRARQQAASGDIPGAIATASKITAGRALYDEAQTDLGGWQAQNQARLWLQDAQQSAAVGSWSNAVATANRIPQDSNQYSQASEVINRASWSLLNQAENAARNDLNQAIALAQQIPSRAEAYTAARARIQAWQTELQERDALELAPAAPVPERLPESAPAPIPEAVTPL